MSGTVKWIMVLALAGVAILGVLVLAVMGRIPDNVLFALVVPLIAFVLSFGLGGVLAQVMNEENIKAVASGIVGLAGGWTLSDATEWIASIKNVVGKPSLPWVYIATVSLLFAVVGLVVGLWLGARAQKEDKDLGKPTPKGVSQALTRFLVQR